MRNLTAGEFRSLHSLLLRTGLLIINIFSYLQYSGTSIIMSSVEICLSEKLKILLK